MGKQPKRKRTRGYKQMNRARKTERNSEIIKLYETTRMSLAEMGRRYGISRVRAWKIVHDYLNKKEG